MKTPSKRKRQQLVYAITQRAEVEREVERMRQVLSHGHDAVVEASEDAAADEAVAESTNRGTGWRRLADARAALEGLRAKLSAAEEKLRWHDHVVDALADNLSIDHSTDLREFSMRRSMRF